MVIEQRWPPVGAVLGRAAGRHLEVPPALQGWPAHAQVARPCSAVCGVVSHRPAWSPRQRLSAFADQGVGALSKAHHRIARVIGFSRHVQDRCPTPDALGTHGGEAPGLPRPGLERGCVSTRRPVSSALGSTTPSATRRSANRGLVHHVRPVGGSRHARALRTASCVPANLRRAPGRGCSCNAASTPASPHRLRVRSLVDTRLWSPWALVASRWPSAAAHTIGARRMRRTEGRPCWMRLTQRWRFGSVKLLWEMLALEASFAGELDLGARLPVTTIVVDH
jgi:hypothetical protein